MTRFAPVPTATLCLVVALAAPVMAQSTSNYPAPPGGSAGPSLYDLDAGRLAYWMVGARGNVYTFGGASAFGGPEGASASGISPSTKGKGYRVVTRDGWVYGYGDVAGTAGPPSDLRPGEFVSTIANQNFGPGYWLFTNKGRVFAGGGAPHFGDMSAVAINGPVVGAASTPTGKGYYMVASDGGIFTFGDAAFRGSMGDQHLNAPVVGLAPDGDNDGYWLVASDGGIFAFKALFKGSMGGTPMTTPVVGAAAYGTGYLMFGSDGGIFMFADWPFPGSLGGTPLPAPIVSVATVSAFFTIYR